MSDEKDLIRQKIAKLEERILSDIAKEKADYLNAVQLVETPQAKEDQIDLALSINYN